MRNIGVWAYHSEFGKLCRNAQLDSKSGLKYPSGNLKGQSGWHVAVKYSNLSDLATKFKNGISMPKEFCGNWFSDCAPIKRGEVKRLAIMCHGDQGGKLLINGKAGTVLTEANVAKFKDDLHDIGLYTRRSGSTILFAGCLAGQGSPGTKLLVGLSQIWPGRQVVGFSTVGYRHPGAMKRIGDACELPGMRETKAEGYLFADSVAMAKWNRMWKNLVDLPWASDHSPQAKVVVTRNVMKWPSGESPK